MHTDTPDTMTVKTLRMPAGLVAAAELAAKKERRRFSDFVRLAVEDRIRKMRKRRAA